MENLNRRFFAIESRKANEEVMNFSGMDLMNEEYMPATGQMVAAPQSDPFVIQLTNTNVTTAVSNVTFLNALEQIGQSSSNYGMSANITILYDIPGVDYDQFLQYLVTTNTLIGKTYIESATATNLTATVKVEVYDVLGGSSSKSYSPVINPNQMQSGVMIWEHQFMMTASTKFTVSSIAANSAVKYRFYPVVTGLKKAAKEYSAPMI